MIGISVAIPAASLCINRRLYQIARVRSVITTTKDKRRAILVDLAIGVGLPVLVMALQYVVQGHRFDIFGDIGCRPFTYNTPLAYPLVIFPPLVIGLISGIYSVLILRSFTIRHLEFKQFMSTNKSITFNRYFRLMALSSIDLLLTIPFAAFTIYGDLKYGKLAPWISWEDTHSGFSRVDEIPAQLWRSDPLPQFLLEFSRWAVVACALVFFAFFGFADEAFKHYRSGYAHLASRLGVKVGLNSTNSQGSHHLPVQSIPVFVSQDVIHKRDTMNTLSDVDSLPRIHYNKDRDSTCTNSSASLRADAKSLPLTATSGSWYSQDSAAVQHVPPARTNSFPVSVTPSHSFLEIITPHPHDSMLSPSVSAHDRV
jgi:pheromone a factor receptor